MDAIVYDKVGKEAEKVRDALYGIYPQETITDVAIASFDDGADSIPVKALTVGVEPVQDLHGYSNPWPAGGNVNKLPTITAATTINGVTWTPTSNGKIIVNGTASENSAIDLGRSVLTLPAGTYTTNQTVNGQYSITVFRIADGSTEVLANGGGTFTISDEASIFVRFYVISGQTVNNVTVEPMLVEGTSLGAFSPYSNICPISGWTGAEVTRTGKNLFDVDAITTIAISDSGVTRNGMFFRKAGTYTVSAQNSGDFLYCRTYNEDGTTKNTYYIVSNATITNASFTIQDGEYFSVYDAISDTVANSKAKFNGWQCQVETGSTATTYHPYTGNQISVTFPSSAGTVYGGTLTLNPDRTGTLVVDHKGKDMGEMIWNYSSNENRFYSASISSEVNKSEVLDTSDELKCSIFKTSPLPVTSLGTLGNGTICVYTNGTTYARWLEYTSPNDFKTAVTGQTLWYPLAAPITIPLTASEVSGILETLYGTNNIWASTGNIEKLTYRADLGKYIDSHITTAVANALNA